MEKEKEIKPIKVKKLKTNELYYQKVQVDKCEINDKKHTHLIANSKRDITIKNWPFYLTISGMFATIALICITTGIIIGKFLG